MMTIEQIRAKAHDYKRAHRWANTVNGDRSVRIIGIGRTWVRLIHSDGRVIRRRPLQITDVW